MPRKGKTTKDFVHRCKTFVVANSTSETILNEIYELRNKVEHLHPLIELYPTVKKEVALARIDSHVRNLEELTRSIYINLLLRVDLLNYFKDNSTIDRLWLLSDTERERLWGNKTELKNDDGNNNTAIEDKKPPSPIKFYNNH